MRLFLALVGLLLATVAEAQIKPVGVFNAIDHLDTLPPWVTVGYLVDNDEARFDVAARHSKRTGFQWILAVYGLPVDDPIGAHGAMLKARIDAVGLAPYVIGVTYGEEWYARLRAGHFAPALPYATEAQQRASVEVVRSWVGRQQGALRAALGVPVLYLDNLVNNSPTQFGAYWYAPVPPNTDVVAIDAYARCGQTFAGSVAPVYAHAFATTTLPIVSVPQWFYTTVGSPFDCGPPADAEAGYTALFQHPRVIGVLGFDFVSRSFMQGWGDVPILRQQVERSMGVPR